MILYDNLHKYIVYLIICLILLYIICKGIIRIIFPFWALQPVFHYYDIQNWISPKGIMHNTPPKINKYVDLQNIQIIDIEKVDAATKTNICNFIRENYLKDDICNYHPSDAHIVGSLHGSNNPSYVCLYKEPYLKHIIGATTTKSLDVQLYDKPTFSTYYVDHLCVNKNNRKKKIAPKLIQTFYYTVSRINTNVNTYFFKREDTLNWMVPLTSFTSFGYKLDSLNSVYNNSLNNKHEVEIKLVDNHLLSDVWNHIIINKSKYDIIVKPFIGNFKHLLDSKLYYVYARINQNAIQDLYIIRNCATSYYDELSVEVIASIAGNDKEAYIQGFIKSIDICCKALQAKNVLIENTSDTYILIDYLQQKCSKKSILLRSPMAYYFYNYAVRPIAAKKCLVLV